MRYKKQQKKSLQSLAAKNLLCKRGGKIAANTDLKVPSYVIGFKRKYTMSEISDLVLLKLDVDYLALDCEFVQTEDRSQCLGEWGEGKGVMYVSEWGVVREWWR